MITVELYSSLRYLVFNDDGLVTVAADRPLTVRELLEKIGLNHGEVDLVICDGRSLLPDDRLEPGCRVALYPIFGGG